MYQAKVLRPQLLQRCIVMLNRHVNHANLYFDTEGLKVMSMNSNQTALMVIKLPMRMIKASKNYCVGVYVPSLLKITQMIKPTESIQFEIDDKATQQIRITFEKQNESYKYFEFKTVELQTPCVIPAEVTFEHTVKIPANDLLKMCKLSQQLNKQQEREHANAFHASKCVDIEYHENQLRLIIQSMYGRGMTTLIRPRMNKTYLNNKYSINNLIVVLEEQNYENIILSWAGETMLRLEYIFDALSCIRYYVAPQVIVE